MLKKRIIPKLLLKNSKKNIPCLVNSLQFKKYQIVGHPISQAKIFEAQHADQLILLNIDSLKLDSNNSIVNLLKDFSLNIFMPLVFGGGVKDNASIELVLKNGADKVSLNSEAIKNKKIISESSKSFGKQCIVISIDYKNNGTFNEVFSDGGTNATGLNLIDWVKEVEDLGAGEILISDIDRDGTGKGLNIEVSKNISDSVDIPVITSGGCGLAKHFVECFAKTDVQGIAAGNYFSLRDQSIYQTRSQLINHKIPLRKI
ncbi:imidazole glycerol phosphate synthase subunit HisF [Pelagibacterales bacterium SAG-MED38]|nr:imidazole glycerol phosphate synthase subunit HisF [Pelagibacterales bacterium SAG-MED38]